MMPGKKRYQVKFRKSARKEFLQLPTKIQDKIVEALSFLAENPFTELLQIKKLRGPEKLYRIRIVVAIGAGATHSSTTCSGPKEEIWSLVIRWSDVYRFVSPFYTHGGTRSKGFFPTTVQ